MHTCSGWVGGSQMGDEQTLGSTQSTCMKHFTHSDFFYINSNLNRYENAALMIKETLATP